MNRLLPLLLALPLAAGAGTQFDEDGNKIDVCQGSTCTPDTTNPTGPTGSIGGQGGQGGQGGVASSQALSAASVSIVNQGRRVPNNTPDAYTSVPPATSPCRIPVGVGGSGPGIGLSFGGSTLDEGCDTREDARTLWAVGLQGAAYARLCQKPEMAKAMGALCPPDDVPRVTVGAFQH